MGVPTLSDPIPRLPGGKDIVIKQNADWSMALTIIERDELGNAVVVDTTGWVVKLQVRKEPKTSSPVLLEASTANGRIVVGIQGDPGDEVNIDIKVPKSVTALLSDFGVAGCDLRVTYPNGDVDYLLDETVLLKPAYTW